MVHLYSRNNIYKKTLMPEKKIPEKDMHIISGQCVCLFWFDSLRPCQQFFSYVGTGLHGLNQY